MGLASNAIPVEKLLAVAKAMPQAKINKVKKACYAPLFILGLLVLLHCFSPLFAYLLKLPAKDPSSFPGNQNQQGLNTPFFAPIWAQTETSLRTAKLAFSRQDWQLSYSLFMQLLNTLSASDSQTPNTAKLSGTVLFYLGYSAEELQDMHLAATHYQEALLFPLDQETKEKVLWKLCLYYKDNHDWEKLFEYTQIFLNFAPRNSIQKLNELAKSKFDPVIIKIQSLKKEAMEHKQANRIIEARLKLQAILSLKPRYIPALWELALLEMQERYYGIALSYLEKIMQKIMRQSRGASSAVATYTGEPRQDLSLGSPSLWKLYYKAAVCSYHLGQYKKTQNYVQISQEYYQKQESNPNLDSDSNSSRSKFFFYTQYMLGTLHLRQAEFQKAKTHLEAAYSHRAAKHLDYTIAYLYWLNQDYNEALERLRSSRANSSTPLAPQDLKGRNASIAYLISAIESYRKQEYSIASKDALRMHIALGERPKAQAIHSLGYLILMEAAAQQERWGLAQFYLKKLESTPLFSLHLAAFTKSSLGNVRSLATGFPGYKAKIAARNGRPREALRLYAQIPISVESYYEIARCYALLSKIAQTQRYLRISMKLPTATTTTQLLQKIQSDPVFRDLQVKSTEFNNFVLYELEKKTSANIASPQSKQGALKSSEGSAPSLEPKLANSRTPEKKVDPTQKASNGYAKSSGGDTTESDKTAENARTTNSARTTEGAENAESDKAAEGDTENATKDKEGAKATENAKTSGGDTTESDKTAGNARTTNSARTTEGAENTESDKSTEGTRATEDAKSTENARTTEDDKTTENDKAAEGDTENATKDKEDYIEIIIDPEPSPIEPTSL